ncbi:MAG: TonB family protein [Fibrobacter sp.]|nr:TonB family protein [Fibrobacter sp.]
MDIHMKLSFIVPIIIVFAFESFSDSYHVSSNTNSVIALKSKKRKKVEKKESPPPLPAPEPLPPPQIEKEPQLIYLEKPSYPLHLSRRGITGAVTLDMLINESGTVDSIYLISGIDPSFDSLVIKALKNARFTAAIAGGKPIAVIVSYSYIQTLDDAISRIQSFTNIRGRLLEKGTRKSISNADVYITCSDTNSDTLIEVPFTLYMRTIGQFQNQKFSDGFIHTKSDSQGYFQFRSIPSGTVSIRVFDPEYEILNITETVSRNEPLNVTYRLKKVSRPQNEIVVYGTTSSDEITHYTLTRDQIRTLPGFNGDALKVIQALPGVARPMFGLGAIRVRGTPSWDSKYYLDGIPIPQLYHFRGIKSTYNSEALETIDFFPGSYGVQYGNSVSGAIQLNSRDAVSQYSGFSDINLFDAFAVAEGPLGKNGGVLASVRRSYIGNILGYIAKNVAPSDFSPLAAPFYYDYLLKSNMKFGGKHNVAVTFFGSNDVLSLIMPSLQAGSADVDALQDRIENRMAFTLLLASYQVPINAQCKNDLKTSIVFENGTGAFFGYAKWNYRSRNLYIKDEFKYKFSDYLSLLGGLDLWFQKYNQSSVIPTYERIFFKDTINQTFGLIAPYLQLETKPVPELTLKTGLRYDYYPELNYNGSLIPEFWQYRSKGLKKGLSGEPSLRISAVYQFTPKQNISFAIGTYSQTPQPLGLAIHDSLGNPELPATKARHISCGYTNRFTEKLFADVQLYFNRQWNIPELISSEDYFANPTGHLFYGNGKGRMYGAELSIKNNFTDNISGWLSYTLSRSERFSESESRYVPYDYDQTHNMQFFISATLPCEWKTGARIRYTTGNPYSPAIDRIYDETNRFYRPVYGPENSARNGSFFQIDFRVDKKFIFNNWVLNGYIDMSNVLWFLYKSPEITIYNYDYTQRTSVSTPFVPSLGIRAAF